MLETLKPQRIENNHPAFFRPEVSLAVNDSDLDRKLQMLEYQKINIPELPENKVLVCPNSYLVKNPPAEHEGSGALYYIDGYYIGSHKIYLSFLPPFSKTSDHVHPSPLEEHYFKPLFGEVYINGAPIPENGIAIGSLEDHQLITKDLPSLTLMMLVNASEVPDHLHHQRK